MMRFVSYSSSLFIFLNFFIFPNFLPCYCHY
uniref:Uncharacterized protein n=1 Tax=Rhizophora mucronata TaxID=61149 RepID=A0A2P2Q9L9_RHIMU